MSTNPVISAVESELRHYPGVAMERQESGTRPRLLFSRNGNSRFLTVPRSPKDWRASKNALRDFRKTMVELGAERLKPTTKRAKRLGVIANLSLNEKNLTLHIPAKSKLISRFKTKLGFAAALWEFEVRASPNLMDAPMLAIRKVTHTPGKTKEHGKITGYLVGAGGWRLPISRTRLRALDRIPRIEPVNLILYEDKGDELVFQLPAGTIPTSFQPHDDQPTPLPSKAFVPVEPEEREALDRLLLEQDADLARAPTPAEIARQRAAAIGQPEQPIMLQFPKQSVSVEAAVAILNKAKRRLGNNLKFQIGEEGYLTATHRIGH